MLTVTSGVFYIPSRHWLMCLQSSSPVFHYFPHSVSPLVLQPGVFGDCEEPGSDVKGAGWNKAQAGQRLQQWGKDLPRSKVRGDEGEDLI